MRSVGWRYLDDIFMIWTKELDHLKISVDYLNNIHSTIKFTSNHTLTNVPFLDVTISLHNGTIETDLYSKPTDKHQLLLSSSCHPQHTKKAIAIPFSLALRIRRICSTDAKFTLRLNELRTYLLARGYGNTFLDSQFKRAANISRTEALHTNRHDSIDRLFFVVTHNPLHFLTFLTSYVNIFIYSFPLNAVGKFLSTHPSSLIDILGTLRYGNADALKYATVEESLG